MSFAILFCQQRLSLAIWLVKSNLYMSYHVMIFIIFHIYQETKGTKNKAYTAFTSSIKSANSRGPIGWFVLCFIPSSMSSLVATLCKECGKLHLINALARGTWFICQIFFPRWAWPLITQLVSIGNILNGLITWTSLKKKKHGQAWF